MLQATTRRVVGVGLAAAMTIAAAFSTTAFFSAPSPGADLAPVNGAELIIDLIQGQEHLLWSSISGTVETVTVIGWPTSDEEHELGGALLIERPENGLAGTIDFGEKPMTAKFDISG